MAEEREPAESHRRWRESSMGRAEPRVSVESGCVVVERPKDYEVLLTEQSEELRKMAVACKEAGCRKVLILGPRTKVRLSVTDIYDLGEEIAKLGLRIAVVESHDASAQDVTFLENVVSNRSTPIRFFHEEQDARDWLQIT